MSEYAVMPITDYSETCDAIREKIDSSDVIKSGEMSDKIGKVYEAGQKSMVDESKIIEKTAIGTTTLTIDDISEIPHDVEVQLDSNLLEMGEDKILFKSGTYILLTENIISWQGNSGNSSHIFFEKKYGAGTYTLSCDIEGGITNRFLIRCYDSSGNVITNALSDYIAFYQANIFNKQKVKVTIPNTVAYWVWGWCPVGASGELITITNPKIEVGDGLTSYEGIKVITRQKNLIPYPYYHTNRTHKGITFTDNGDGTITANGTATGKAEFYVMENPLSAELNFGGCNFSGCPEGGSTNTYYMHAVITGHKEIGNGVYIDNFKGSYLKIRIVIEKGTVANNLVFKPILALGKTKPKYEPSLDCEEYISPSNGLIIAKSVSPNMIFISEKVGIVIKCRYHKSWGMQTEYDRFWDSFQDCGKRKEYNGAFYGAGWTPITFKPKYDIVPTVGANLFRGTYVNMDGLDLVERLKELGIKLDMSKLTGAWSSVFQRCGFSRIGELDARGAVSFAYSFAEFYTMPHTIDKIILKDDGSQNMANAFAYSSALENVTFEGKIGTNLDMHWSTKLTHDSLMSILNALYDYSGSSTTYTCNLGTTNLAKLTDVEKAIATQKGWTLA